MLIPVDTLKPANFGCPYCGSQDVSFGELRLEARAVKQSGVCHSCAGAFTRHFAETHVEVANNSSLSGLQVKFLRPPTKGTFIFGDYVFFKERFTEKYTGKHLWYCVDSKGPHSSDLTPKAIPPGATILDIIVAWQDLIK